MLNVNILDPNLGQTHPTLVPWVQGMRSAGYTAEQIQMYFRQQMQAQMGLPQPQQMHPQQQHVPPNQQLWIQNDAQQQQKLQMAQNIAQAYEGRVTLQQILQMPFERVQGLHNEIVSRLNQSQVQHNKYSASQIAQPPPNKKRKLNSNDSDSISSKKEEECSSDKMEELKKENEQLRKQNDDLNKEVNELKMRNSDLNHLDKLDEEQLDELEVRMQNKIKSIREAKDRLLEIKTRCVACLSNHKNIVIQGCNHFDLCEECEQKLEPKICPRCQLPFEHVIKIKN